MLSSQVDRDDPLYIYGPPRIAEYIETSRRVLDMYINYEIVVKEISAPAVVHQGEGFRIRAFALRHTKPCLGYTLEEEGRPGIFFPEKALAAGVPRGPLWARLQAGENVQTPSGEVIHPRDVLGPPRSGRKFSFVTDTLSFPGVAAEVAGSDLFVCEGRFETDLEESARAKKHMTAAQAAGIAAAAGGIRKLALIHYSPRYNEQNLKGLLAEAQRIFPDTVLSRDRMVLPIDFVD
jgi:ribonuclease Z